MSHIRTCPLVALLLIAGAAQAQEPADPVDEGGLLDQGNNKVSYEEEKTIIKSLAHRKWHSDARHMDKCLNTS